MIIVDYFTLAEVNMGIINAFDNTSEEILKPSYLSPKVRGFPETVVVTFKQKIIDIATALYGKNIISEMHAGIAIPIYSLDYNDKNMAIYLTWLGGPASVGLLEEIIAKGAKKIVFFGSCGTLDKSLAAGHLIVPTSAYRDEGTSYHYAPASDYIEVKTAARLAEILTEMDIPFICGKTWTTDAFYRETRNKMEQRKKDGCITVEMECASIMAASQYRGIELYQYLYAEDNLDSDLWDSRTMGKVPQSANEQYLRIALEIASRV